MKRTLFLFSVALLLISFSATVPASAQEDVCCIIGKKAEGGGVTTRALPKNPADCKAGSTAEDGYQVCMAQKDPNNDCPSMRGEAACKACGYFWDGTTCLAENPVDKAKAELKKEEEAKKAGEKK